MSARALQDAVEGRGGSEAKVLHGARPPALDGPSLRAATTPLMAAFMVAAAVLRARMETAAPDLIGVGLRVLAVAFVLRALVDLGRLFANVARDARAAAHTLAYDEEGLLLVSPSGSIHVQRADVAAVVTAPAKLPGEAKRRARPVWLALYPGAGDHTGWLSVPPYFAADSDVLVARLTRWLGDSRPPEHSDQGNGEQAWSARRVRGFWKRAPWGWLLLGLASLELLRVAPEAWRPALVLPVTVMASLTLLAPLGWVLWVHRRTRTPAGLLLTLTPTHAAAITRAGSVTLRWREVSEVELAYRGRWSPFEGAYAVRLVELRGRDGSSLRFDSSLLDAPVEVVAAVAAKLAGVDVQGP